MTSEQIEQKLKDLENIVISLAQKQAMQNNINESNIESNKVEMTYKINDALNQITQHENALIELYESINGGTE